jgi:hypothetical protein
MGRRMEEGKERRGDDRRQMTDDGRQKTVKK